MNETPFAKSHFFTLIDHINQVRINGKFTTKFPFSIFSEWVHDCHLSANLGFYV